jgi:hypothetical protein
MTAALICRLIRMQSQFLKNAAALVARVERKRNPDQPRGTKPDRQESHGLAAAQSAATERRPFNPIIAEASITLSSF